MALVANQSWAAAPEAWVMEQDCRFVTDFTQTRAFPDGVNYLKTAGKLYFDCDRGLIWSMESPIVSSQVFLLSGAMYYLDSTNAVRPLENPIQRKVGGLLSALLQGDRKKLEAEFRLLEGAGELVLEPRAGQLRRALRRIVISEASEAGGRIVLIEQADGQSLTVAIEPPRTFAAGHNPLSSCYRALGPVSEQSCPILQSTRE